MPPKVPLRGISRGEIDPPWNSGRDPAYRLPGSGPAFYHGKRYRYVDFAGGAGTISVSPVSCLFVHHLFLLCCRMTASEISRMQLPA